MQRRHLGMLALALGMFETACLLEAKDVGELLEGSSDASGDVGDTSGSATAGSDGATSSDPPQTGSEGTDGGEPSPWSCGPDGPECSHDQDHDCVGLEDDNAPDVYNPDQRDIDEDGIPDPIDLCPSVPSLPDADSDHDGLGNECDPCRNVTSSYQPVGVPVSGYMRVRNVPSTADADGDGIGDACDNCILVPNCEGYGPADPWQPGDPIADGDLSVCQQGDADGLGDVCQGLPPLAGAAGFVGLGSADDFDQDGLTNVVDACPRAPLSDVIACTDDGDCPQSRKCETAMGLCDHHDLDADGVGDLCDNCPYTENPLQVADGAMTQDDDDEDFRGNACELDMPCETVRDPARFAFYPASAEGWCCTIAYRGDDEHFDPYGRPLRVDCTDEQQAAQECRRIPPQVAVSPGFLVPPPGCEAALADAGLTLETNLPLGPADVGGLEELWPYACKLPPLDQDFDGLGDACDLCPLAFDPENVPYTDPNGAVWPDEGKYCNGEFAIENVCMGS